MIVGRDLSADSDRYVCVPLETVVDVARWTYYVARTLSILGA